MGALFLFIKSACSEPSRVLGPERSGDCYSTCSGENKQCDESLGRQAASNANNVQFDGIDCQGRNGWNYGQGFSQCRNIGCCGDSSCRYHCSVTSRWPGCKINDGFASGHHSRICPCTDCEQGYTEVLGRCFQRENTANTYAADSNAEYAFVSGELADNITTTISQYEGSGLDDLQLQNCRGGSSKKGTKCILLKMTTGAFDNRLCEPQYSSPWCPKTIRRRGKCPLCTLRKSDLSSCMRAVRKEEHLDDRRYCCAHFGLRKRLGLAKQDLDAADLAFAFEAANT